MQQGAFDREATTILWGLVQPSTQQALRHASTPAMDAVEACLARGADPSGALLGQDFLALSLGCPSIAQRLLLAGAKPSRGVPSLLHLLLSSSPSHEVFSSGLDRLSLDLARKFPGLDWYEWIGPPEGQKGLFSHKLPACMWIEQKVDGFNAVLEQAQQQAGLEVGGLCRLETVEQRKAALAECVMPEPCVFWLGDRSRLDVVRQLLGEDISVSERVGLEGEDGDTLLESFMKNIPDVQVVEYLVSLRAPISAQMVEVELPRLLDECAPADRHRLAAAIFSHPDLDLDKIHDPDAGMTLCEALGQKGGFLAAYLAERELSQGVDTIESGVGPRPRL